MREISNSATAVQFVFRLSCSLCSHAPCPVPSPSLSLSSPAPAPAPIIVDVNGVVHAALRFLKNVSLSFVHRRHRSERCWCRARRSLSSRPLPFVGVVHTVLRFLKNISLSFVHHRHRSERCWRRTQASLLPHPLDTDIVGVVPAAVSPPVLFPSPLSPLQRSSAVCSLPEHALSHPSVIFASAAIHVTTGVFLPLHQRHSTSPSLSFFVLAGFFDADGNPFIVAAAHPSVNV